MSVSFRKLKDHRLVTLLTAANFLAAFANGTVLYKYPMGRFESAIADFRDMIGNPLLALMVGTLLGLPLIKFMPHRWVKWASGVSSIAAGMISLLLVWCLDTHNAHQHGSRPPVNMIYLFFVLLCVRFGLWFASRSFRSDVAASRKGRIGWVELANSVGMILGLVIWVYLTPPRLEVFEVVLYLDFALLTIAGLFDILSNLNFSNTSAEEMPTTDPSRRRGLVFSDYMAVLVITVALTVGIQIVAFALHVTAKKVNGVEGPFSHILAAFYFGAAAASLAFGKSRQVRFRWPRALHASRYFPTPVICLGDGKRSYSLLTVSLLGVSAVVLSVLAYWGFNLASPVLPLIVVAAFMLELIALSLFEWAGRGDKGEVAVMFGMMGMAGMAGLYLLCKAFTPNGHPYKHYVVWIVTSAVCLLIANAAVPVAFLLSRLRAKPDSPDGGTGAPAVLSLSSPGIQRAAPAGEAAEV